jgi:hypothetical protein
MGAGFTLQVIGRYICSASRDRASFSLGLALILLGAGIFVWACRRYAFSKGYPRWLGWLGLASCLGAIVLFLLPNRRKEAGGAFEPEKNAPR